MPLPIKELATATVTIDGTEVEYRALSREEALRLNGFAGGREDEAEVFIIVCGTGVSEEEAREFRSKNDTLTAGLLIDGILILSGLANADGTDADPN